MRPGLRSRDRGRRIGWVARKRRSKRKRTHRGGIRNGEGRRNGATTMTARC